MEITWQLFLLILFGFIGLFFVAGVLFSEDYITFKQAIIIWSFALLSLLSILWTSQEVDRVVKIETCHIVESTINKDSLSQLLNNKDFSCVCKNSKNEIISAELKAGEYKTFISDDENFTVKVKTIDEIATHKYLFLFDLSCDLSKKDKKEYEIYIPTSSIQ